jgi:phage baseplate assembly protein W
MSTINRRTRTFSDLNLIFSSNPVTGDVTKTLDEEAIKASVRNLVLTKNYERPFHPEIGCQAYGLLFENFSPVTVKIMERTIADVIEKFEPRVRLVEVKINDQSDSNSIRADIFFRIVNTERPVQLSTTITRVRYWPI